MCQDKDLFYSDEEADEFMRIYTIVMSKKESPIIFRYHGKIGVVFLHKTHIPSIFSDIKKNHASLKRNAVFNETLKKTQRQAVKIKPHKLCEGGWVSLGAVAVCTPAGKCLTVRRVVLCPGTSYTWSGWYCAWWTR